MYTKIPPRAYILQYTFVVWRLWSILSLEKCQFTMERKKVNEIDVNKY